MDHSLPSVELYLHLNSIPDWTPCHTWRKQEAHTHSTSRTLVIHFTGNKFDNQHINLIKEEIKSHEEFHVKTEVIHPISDEGQPWRGWTLNVNLLEFPVMPNFRPGRSHGLHYVVGGQVCWEEMFLKKIV